MADTGPQQANHPTGDLFPRSSARPGPQYHHALHNARIPRAASSGQLEGQWEDALHPSATVEGAVQGALPDPQHINVTNYGIPYYPDLPDRQDPAVSGIYPNLGLIQGVPEQHQVIFPENQGNDRFGYAPRDVGHLVPGPNQAPFPGPSTHRASPLCQQPATDNLRQLASRCVHHPDSEVDMVQMEPATAAGRFKVVIVLEMTGFL